MRLVWLLVSIFCQLYVIGDVYNETVNGKWVCEATPIRLRQPVSSLIHDTKSQAEFDALHVCAKETQYEQQCVISQCIFGVEKHE